MIPKNSEYLRAVQRANGKKRVKPVVVSDESDHPNPFSLKHRQVPKDGVTFGPAKRAQIVRVLHPGTGQVHRIQMEGDARKFHDALIKNGYLHPHPRGAEMAQVWAAIHNSPSNKGRGTHIVNPRGYYRDGEHVEKDDVSVEKNGRLLHGQEKIRELRKVGE